MTGVQYSVKSNSVIPENFSFDDTWRWRWFVEELKLLMTVIFVKVFKIFVYVYSSGQNYWEQEKSVEINWQNKFAESV